MHKVQHQAARPPCRRCTLRSLAGSKTTRAIPRQKLGSFEIHAALSLAVAVVTYSSPHSTVRQHI
jgi:hypothetical protein